MVLFKGIVEPNCSRKLFDITEVFRSFRIYIYYESVCVCRVDVNVLKIVHI